MPEKMETRPRRVTLSSEERCRKAFDTTYPAIGLSDWEAAVALHAWEACWRYLERKVQEEFISA